MAGDVRNSANFRNTFIKVAGLRLSDDPDRDATEYVDLIVTSGAPSGAYGRLANVLIACNRSAAAGDDVFYVTVDNGTTWSTLDAALASDFELPTATQLTISSGAITSTQAFHTIDTEGGIGSDDVDTINGVGAGELVYLLPNNDSRTVVLKHGTGNITCPGGRDVTLDDDTDYAIVIGTASGVVVFSQQQFWEDLASTSNGLGASMVGTEDSAGYYADGDVESNLVALGTQIGGDSDAAYAFGEQNVVADDDAIYEALNKVDLKWGDLASTATSEGASLVGVEDSGALFGDAGSAHVEAVLAAARTSDKWKAATQRTISSGEITATQKIHALETEGGIGSDDLDTINGVDAGEFVFIGAYDGAHDVVLKHGTGNILCPRGQDITLAEATDWVLLYSDGTNLSVVAACLLAGRDTDSSTIGIAATDSGNASISVGGATDSDTASVTEDEPEVFVLEIKTAAAANVVAPLAGVVDETTWANITQPDIPRGVEVVFAGGWDGGDITIEGLTVSGDDTTEVISAVGAGTVESVYGWRLIRRVATGPTHSSGTATVQTTNKPAVWIGDKTPTLLEAYQVDANGRDTGATMTANGLLTWTSVDAPNGVHEYLISYSLAGGYTDGGHTHTSSALTATDSGHTHSLTDGGHTHTAGI